MSLSLLDATDSELQWLSLLSSRFYGRINNRPEVTIEGTRFSSGGACEYEVSILYFHCSVVEEC